MSTSQQLNLTGGLISFANVTIFQEKLMQNFFIINNKLKKIDEFSDLDARLRGLQKQLKFTKSKVQSFEQKIPKDGIQSKVEIARLTKQNLIDILNNQDQKFNRSKFVEEIRRDIKNIVQQLTRFGSKKIFNIQNALPHNNLKLDEVPSQISPQNKLSLTARQVLINADDKKNTKELKQSPDNSIEKNSQKISNVIDSDIVDQIHEKIQDLYRKIEQMKIGKSLNDYASKTAQRFQKYERYEQKSQQKNRSQIKLEGIKHQNLKGQFLKNDLYSEMQRAQVVKNQLNRQIPSRKSSVKPTAFTQYKQHQMKKTDGFQNQESQVKFQRSKSTKKLQRIERRLKADDIKDLNPVLKEIQIRIQNKVSHDIFMGFIQDFQEKLQILRVTNDTTTQLHDIKKFINSIEHRINSIINYLQSLANQDDALIVKKQWTCVSCDKNLEKYGGKLGQHLNWDLLNSKKISPTKAGAFGQTSQLATKIRHLIETQKGQE